MHKGAPILRSALTGRLRLELTYRDPFAKERADEFSDRGRLRHIGKPAVDNAHLASGIASGASCLPERVPEV